MAFKEIKQEFAHDVRSQARFLLEAEITGGLEHPGIVLVYSLGNHADGRPYYAMRFIRGESLRDTCDAFHKKFEHSRDTRAWNLELQKLLRRFLDICNAIEYAHSRGVLHRDLKPANVMLGRYGETLVVDWGLAKVLGAAECADGDGAETTLRPPSHAVADPTQQGRALGTLAYMPPEQAAGQLELLSPASDVYSLGATLYHLLTGQVPFKRQHEKEDVRQRVIQGHFPLPRHIDRRISAPLEAICLQAMSCAPAERYQSARALADDLEHYLADEPVTAYREPVRQRVARLARRHKSWTQAAAAALVLVTGVSVVATLLISRALRREEEQRRFADWNFAAAQKAVDDFYTTVSESTLLNVPGMQPLRRQLLEQAKEYYEGFIEQRAADEQVQQKLGAAYQRAAMINAELSATSEALAGYDRARDIFEKLVRENPQALEFQRDLGNCHSNLGILQSAIGRDAEALATHQRAIEILEKLARDKPDLREYQGDLAGSYNNQGISLRRMGRNVEALASYERAREIQENLVRESPSVAQFQSDLALTYNNLGTVQRDLKRNGEAANSYELARRIQEELSQDEPNVPKYQSDLAGSHHNLGIVQRALGRVEEALDNYECAAAILEKLVRDNPEVPKYQSDLARGHNSLGFPCNTSSAREEILAAPGCQTNDRRCHQIAQPFRTVHASALRTPLVT